MKQWYTIAIINGKDKEIVAKVKSKGLAYHVFEKIKELYPKKRNNS